MSSIVLWTTDVGGYQGGDPTNPVFQDLIVRWFQFGAFCPLFRTHGDRAGGPPVNECGDTNGDNEVWNLAKDQDHYNAMATVMHIRENIRPYIVEINAEAARSGMPMIRPMFLQFPNDSVCQTAQVEDQYMFGPNWLVVG
jgi:alpha-D-xyloside xylohydrolase